jgi:hypothetical protein
MSTLQGRFVNAYCEMKRGMGGAVFNHPAWGIKGRAWMKLLLGLNNGEF